MEWSAGLHLPITCSKRKRKNLNHVPSLVEKRREGIKVVDDLERLEREIVKGEAGRRIGRRKGEVTRPRYL